MFILLYWALTQAFQPLLLARVRFVWVAKQLGKTLAPCWRHCLRGLLPSPLVTFTHLSQPLLFFFPFCLGGKAVGKLERSLPFFPPLQLLLTLRSFRFRCWRPLYCVSPAFPFECYLGGKVAGYLVGSLPFPPPLLFLLTLRPPLSGLGPLFRGLRRFLCCFSIIKRSIFLVRFVYLVSSFFLSLAEGRATTSGYNRDLTVTCLKLKVFNLIRYF